MTRGIINLLQEGNSVITPLKFDEDVENQGIFFVNTGNGSETRADGRMLKNKPGS